MSDASFKDGRETPLKLIALDTSDLSVVSAMTQDAIAQRKDMLFEQKKHCFTLLLKRFRWEDVTNKRSLERVQSILMFKSVLKVRHQGFALDDKSQAFALIGIHHENGTIFLSFAGKAEIALEVECLDALLSDVSQPYLAKSQILPAHKDI